MRGIFLFLVIPMALAAQSFQGGLRGSVLDTQGAVVTLSKVTLIDEATNISRATLTNHQGEFVFNALNPATYSVLVEAPGFKKVDRRGVVVDTQEFITLDLRLEVGQVTETVNVTEESPLIETSNASTGQVIDSQKLTDLPNLGRNPFMMSKLSQNVVLGGDPKFNRMQDQSGSSQISIAGGPVRGNNYLLDGISITDSTNRAVIIPSLEAVMEVKIQANTYDAEVGRTGGGTFNTYLKTGTNQLHGSLFGYMRQTEWLANNFFANRAGTPRVEQPFRNFGGSLGGPIAIPKIYNGRNKTFFWIAAEGYRQHEAASTTLAVPTALERTGNFSQSVNSKGAPQIIYDPLSTRADGSRDPFPGNIIPQNRLSPIGLALASYYPLPNKTGAYYGATDFNATAIQYNRADQITGKLEHSLTSWWRASISYLHYKSREPSNNYFGNIASPGQSLLYRKVDATQVNTTLMPNATTVVTARYGFNRFPNLTVPYSAGFDLTALGFSPSLISQLPVTAFPGITMGDLASYGGGGVARNVYHSKSFSVSASKYKGRHSLKAGFDYRALHHDGLPTVTPGAYSFSNTFTNAKPTVSGSDSGASLASLLLGFPSAGSVTTSVPLKDYVNYYGFFVHDDFRVNSKLTVNFGLRYEYETGIQESNNSFIVGFDTQAQNPIGKNIGISTPGVIRYAGVDGNGTTSGNPNRDKFAPRIGVAYVLNPKTTLRGGYGIFWAPIPFSLFSPIGYSQTTSYTASFDNNFTPANSLANPFPTGILKPVGNSGGLLTGIGQSISVYDPQARSTMVQQYSFDVQRELKGGLVLALGYGGSKTSHLVQGTASININQLDPKYLSLGSSLNQSVPNPFYNNGGQFALANATVTRAQLLLPFPQYTSVFLLNSDRNRALYHSLYLKAQKRFSAGLTLLSTYTWSQNFDASNAGAGNIFDSQSSSAQNNYDLGAEYSLATINTPHRWTSAATYELPVGKGKRFINSNRYADLAVGGWSVNVISSFQTGFPLSINQNNTNGILGTSNQRPNATGISPETAGSLEDRLDGYVNKAAFTAAPQFTFGNVSRTLGMRGPGQANWDLSLFKTFRITERAKAQFRAEALNALNTPQFYGPNVTFGSPTFGVISSQANFSRLIQLGVRLTY